MASAPEDGVAEEPALDQQERVGPGEIAERLGHGRGVPSTKVSAVGPGEKSAKPSGHRSAAIRTRVFL